MLGVVQFFNRWDGFSQILGTDHRLYWTHRKELSGCSELTTGCRVEFDVLEHARGLRAIRVRLAAAPPSAVDHQR